MCGLTFGVLEREGSIVCCPLMCFAQAVTEHGTLRRPMPVKCRAGVTAGPESWFGCPVCAPPAQGPLHGVGCRAGGLQAYPSGGSHMFHQGHSSRGEEKPLVFICWSEILEFLG